MHTFADEDMMMVLKGLIKIVLSAFAILSVLSKFFLRPLVFFAGWAKNVKSKLREVGILKLSRMRMKTLQWRIPELRGHNRV